MPDDDRLVRHRRHIGAAGRAGAHHAGDLRNAEGREGRLVVEDAAEMLAVREDLGLVRQVRAAAVHQVEARQTILPGDLLCAEVLLHGQRIIGAAFDRRVVADDHHLLAHHPPDAGNHAGGVDRVPVHPVGGERRELRERRAGVQEAHHALRGRSLPRARWRSRAFGGPPCATAARFSCRSFASCARPPGWPGRPRLQVDGCGDDGHALESLPFRGFRRVYPAVQFGAMGVGKGEFSPSTARHPVLRGEAVRFTLGRQPAARTTTASGAGPGSHR